MEYYGLYDEVVCACYSDDGGGSDHKSYLLGVSDNKDDLAARWNAAKDAERTKLKEASRHISYIDAVPPNIQKGRYSVSYYGSNGGGYSSVSHKIIIKPIEQKI